MKFDTYAIADVHGRTDHIERLLDEIHVSAIATGYRIVFLGDIIDRGYAPTPNSTSSAGADAIATCYNRMIALDCRHSRMRCAISGFMHVITQKKVWAAKDRWPQAANALDTWYRLMKSSEPTDFADMKSLFPATDKVGRHHVFDIGGNKLRLIAIVHYKFKKVYIQEIMDHAGYDKGTWKG